MYPVYGASSAPPMNGAPMPPYPSANIPPYPMSNVPPYPPTAGGFPSTTAPFQGSPMHAGYASAPPLVGAPPQQMQQASPYPAQAAQYYNQFQTPPPTPPVGGGGYPTQMASNQQMNQHPSGMNQRPPTTSSTALTSRVELIVSAKNLLDMDTFSKSDPVCVLYRKDTMSNNFFEVGRTEIIKNNLNPAWNTKFTVDYRFEERQVFKFAIYDWDNSSQNVQNQDYLGCIECSLGEIVAAPNAKFERNLQLPPGYRGKSSQIVIHAQELGTNKEVLYMKMRANGLDKKDWFGKSDPYVVIAKKMDDGSWTNVHKTQVIKNTLNPDWQPFSVRVVSLTSGKLERALRFQVWDWNMSGASDFIGEFETNYAEIQSRAKGSSATYTVINPKKQAKKKSYKDSGTLTIEWIRVEEEKTFLDYIQSGVQLHFTVAIDFTASNGDPRHQNSLHYRHPQLDNQYSIAIKSVGEIIQDYDSDKLFPALGFGARIPPHNSVNHEFYLNGNPENPYVEGVGGILQAYYRSLDTVELYGPTYFAPVVNHVARLAASHQDGKNYFVLLIITDGIICDLEATKEAIINASALPMSLIIVGVGNEDFSAMEFLDSDDRLLRHNGRSAVRDIVQFVELQKYILGASQNQTGAKIALAADVLAELPGQLCAHMKKASGLW